MPEPETKRTIKELVEREKLKTLLARLIKEMRILITDEDLRELEIAAATLQEARDVYVLEFGTIQPRRAFLIWPYELHECYKQFFESAYDVLHSLYDLDRVVAHALHRSKTGRRTVDDKLAFYYATLMEEYGLYDLKLQKEWTGAYPPRKSISTRYFIMRPLIDVSINVVKTTFIEDGEERVSYWMDEYKYRCESLGDGRVKHIFELAHDTWEKDTLQEELPCAAKF